MTDTASQNRPILFIHGFGSCGTGTKAQTLREHFGHQQLIAPDLPVDPGESLAVLQQLIEQFDPVASISSSLGSYYATWLNQHQPLPSVLINPAVKAPEILAEHVGKHQHWCTGETFELTKDHIYQLEKLRRDRLDETENYLVLLQSADETLDYRDAARYYQGQQVIIEPGGNHRFENLHEYLTIIDRFINDHSSLTDSNDQSR